MLLELPVPALSQMLQDEAKLTTAVEKAFRALQLEQESRCRYWHGRVLDMSFDSVFVNMLVFMTY